MANPPVAGVPAPVAPEQPAWMSKPVTGEMLFSVVQLLAGRSNAPETATKIMSDLTTLMTSGDPAQATEILKPEKRARGRPRTKPDDSEKKHRDLGSYNLFVMKAQNVAGQDVKNHRAFMALIGSFWKGMDQSTRESFNLTYKGLLDQLNEKKREGVKYDFGAELKVYERDHELDTIGYFRGFMTLVWALPPMPETKAEVAARTQSTNFSEVLPSELSMAHVSHPMMSHPMMSQPGELMLPHGGLEYPGGMMGHAGMGQQLPAGVPDLTFSGFMAQVKQLPPPETKADALARKEEAAAAANALALQGAADALVAQVPAPMPMQQQQQQPVMPMPMAMPMAAVPAQVPMPAIPLPEAAAADDEDDSDEDDSDEEDEEEPVPAPPPKKKKKKNNGDAAVKKKKHSSG